MIVRVAIIGFALALAGCGREAERSSVVPPSGTGSEDGGGVGIPPQDIRKIEMH